MKNVTLFRYHRLFHFRASRLFRRNIRNFIRLRNQVIPICNLVMFLASKLLNYLYYLPALHII